jgi:DNA-directed RNA polymerase subunit RPC12/RpoP
MESIENTEEKFEPRFQIELSKAGETPENPYLFDPNKPMSRPRKQISIGSIRRPFSGPKNIYKCGTCGKKFYRKTQNSKINPHKNKSGYLCHGYGVYVGVKY